MRSSTTRSGSEALARSTPAGPSRGDLHLEALAPQPGRDRVRDRGSSSTTRIVRGRAGAGADIVRKDKEASVGIVPDVWRFGADRA